MMIRTLIFCIFYLSSLLGKAGDNLVFYVSPKGNDRNVGTIESPLKSLRKVRNLVRFYTKNGLKNNIEFRFREGVYHVDSTLMFFPEDGGNTKYSIRYVAWGNEKVSFTSLQELKLKWVPVGNDIWQSTIGYKNKEPKSDLLRNLYMNNELIPRSTSIDLFTSSRLPAFQSSFARFDMHKNVARLRGDSISAFCGFKFEKDDIPVRPSPSVEIILYGSWEASWHRIAMFDSIRQTVFFKSPSRYPVGYFSERMKYRIENSKRYLNRPYSWCHQSDKNLLFIKMKKGEDPNRFSFSTPILNRLFYLKGRDTQPLQNLHFEGIEFSGTLSQWGVSNVPKDLQSESKAKYNWLDFSSGFTSGQGAFDCGESILLVNSSRCSFSKCTFKNLGAYAIRIGERSINNIITRCQIFDCGGGGIIIGFNDNDPVKRKIPISLAPSYNIVSNNIIKDNGVVHPSSIGIAIIQSHNNMVEYNLISNQKYSGISCGWNFNAGDNFTFANVIRYNIVKNVMRELADGGGIYTLGKQEGSKFIGNWIFNIKKSETAVGAEANGLFFDEFSSEFMVDSNVVFSIKDNDVRYNKSSKKSITFGSNSFEKSEFNNKVVIDLRKRLLKVGFTHEELIKQ